MDTTNRTRLLHAIDQVFNESELQTIAFDLDIDYENLAGKTKIDKARELLAFCRRSGRLDDLLALCRELRPQLEWAAPDPDDDLAEPPFKGLQFFAEQDADLFFGREALVEELTGRLAGTRFLAVVGASGSGKSSLLRAGLIPALKKQDPPGWRVHVITPTGRPLAALAASLTRDDPSPAAAAPLQDDLAREPRTLDLAARRLLEQEAAGRLLLLVDQFEELFTLCRSEPERSAFLANLLTAAGPSEGAGPLTLVIALRADFYERCAEYDELRQALAHHQEYIGPMRAAELRQVIIRPAEEAGLIFEEGLVDLILRDLGVDDAGDDSPEPGALPLLSHALLETWRLREGKMLTFAGYAAAGGVRQAIAHTADAVFEKLPPADQPTARRIFLRLTELGEGTQDTRRRARLEELTPAGEAPDPIMEVIAHLTSARLLTAGEDGLEVAHEALIREWPRLRRWLDDNREALRLHRRLADAAAEWRDHHEEPGFLYRGGRLAAVDEWLANPDAAAELTALESRFVEASRKEQERLAAEGEAQQRREELLAAERRSAALRGRLAAALGVAAVLLIIAAIFAFSQRSAAEEARSQAEAARETAVAESTRANDAALAAEMARATAGALAAANAAEAALALTREAEAVAAESTIAAANAETNQAKATSDAALATAVSAQATAEVAQAAEIAALEEARRRIQARELANASQLAFERGERELALLLAVAAVEITADPRPTARQALLSALNTRSSGRPSIPSFQARRSNPNGITSDATLQAFALQPGRSSEEIGRLVALALRTGVRSYPLCPGSENEGGLLCDGDPTGTSLTPYDGMEDRWQNALFSPDGRFLALPGENGLLLWQLAEEPFSSITLPISGNLIVFSPDSDQLAVEAGGQLYLWPLDQSSLTAVPAAQVGLTPGSDVLPPLNALALSPEGDRLATTGGGRASLWRIDGENLVLEADWPFLEQFSGGTIAFSPDGRWLAVTNLTAQNGGVALLDLEADDPLAQGIILPGAGTQTRLVFSNDSRLLLGGTTNSSRNEVLVWEFAAAAERSEPAEPLIFRFDRDPRGASVTPLTPRFTTDGGWIVTIVRFNNDYYDSGEVFLWPLDPALQVAEACRQAGRDLTPAERQEFLAAAPDLTVCSR